mmetsp:Transcript_14135/g.42588  ORF Transcript_14135/g.42588 Transcript_14135/m.42588 type:complete len:255 (+) Transcript_14135:588-1352(+)
MELSGAGLAAGAQVKVGQVHAAVAHAVDRRGPAGATDGVGVCHAHQARIVARHQARQRHGVPQQAVIGGHGGVQLALQTLEEEARHGEQAVGAAVGAEQQCVEHVRLREPLGGRRRHTAGRRRTYLLDELRHQEASETNTGQQTRQQAEEGAAQARRAEQRQRAEQRGETLVGERTLVDGQRAAGVRVAHHAARQQTQQLVEHEAEPVAHASAIHLADLVDRIWRLLRGVGGDGDGRVVVVVVGETAQQRLLLG